MNKQIYCTLGPSTLNKNFLKFASKKVNLLRLNMSHIDIEDLQKILIMLKNILKLKFV